MASILPGGGTGYMHDTNHFFMLDIYFIYNNDIFEGAVSIWYPALTD